MNTHIPWPNTWTLFRRAFKSGVYHSSGDVKRVVSTNFLWMPITYNVRHHKIEFLIVWMSMGGNMIKLPIAFVGVFNKKYFTCWTVSTRRSSCFRCVGTFYMPNAFQFPILNETSQFWMSQEWKLENCFLRWNLY